MTLETTETGTDPATSVASDPAAQLAERLSDPGVANSLNTLLDHVDLLALLVSGLDQLVARSDVIGDSLAAGLAELRGVSESAGAGVDIAGIATSGGQLASVLPKLAPQLVAVVESGAVDKALATLEVSTEALPQVEMLAETLQKGTARFETDPVTVGGPVSLVRQLRDPEISTALSYLLTMAKTLGAELRRR
ncbi:MAG: DUF1641 domain-containing protein [Actinomycetia bacterium]|nr:DUF1641 domain-containing protein [Actinomycetes bacterium]